MNWKTYIEKKNAKIFVLPAGWDSRDEVAEQLECSPDKVDDHLRPALKSGEILKQQFKVWDASLKKLSFVTAYKEAAKNSTEDAQEQDLVAMKKMKDGGMYYAEIGSKIGRSGDYVRSRLRRAKTG